MSYLPDEVLARRAAIGNLDSFEELLARYRVRIYRLCYRMAGNAEDAEDWTQECFVRAYQQLTRYNAQRPFAPWLLRVASNTCINLAKSRTRRQEHLQLGLDKDLCDTRAATDPTRAAFAGEDARVTRAALETLTPVLRQAFVIWALEELSFRELAETLGVPLSTAAARVRRALLQMRERLIQNRSEVER